MEYWAIALIFLILGLGLALLEVFLPSGGLLGFLCIVSIVGAIYMGFLQSPAVGVSILAMAGLGLPAMVALAFKLLPNTPVGRRLLLNAPTEDDVLPDDERQRSLKDLVGHTGRAKSKMLPAGVIKIDGRTIDAVTEGMPAEPGQAVRVIEVRGNRVVVRPIEEGSVVPDPQADDVLARPIDAIGSDPFDEESSGDEEDPPRA
ncbi:MAG: hypothetical protein JW818_00500 [Pirellulales bacterium]|nr:hypothetical protein [Pirellulales bacterium]